MRLSFRRFAIALVAVLCTLGFVGVVLADPPSGDFDFLPSVPDVGQSVTFTAKDLADSDGGTPSDVTWNFGDGGTDSGSSVSHPYTNAGDKTVTMTIADPQGTDPPTTVTKTLHVNAPPSAQVTCTPETVAAGVGTNCTSNGSSDAETTALTYAWDIDGDGFDDGSDQNETFTFGTPGTTRTIRLQVKDANGATAVAQDTVTVTNATPFASLAVSPNPARISQTVTFNGSSSSDPGGSIVLYEWDLDGNPNGANAGFEVSGTNPETSRSYANANSYTIRLRVVDNNGGSAIDSETLHIFANVPPSVSASAAPNPAQIGDTVSFATTANDQDGTITGYQWDLDGNGTFDEDVTSASPSRTYATAGTRSVRVRVTDNDGAIATDVVSLRINAPPTASFTITPTPALIHEAIQLDASSSGDFEGAITTYEWDFDYTAPNFDVNATGITTTTSYTTDGTKTVALRVTDEDDATTVLPRPVVVQLTRPHAVFAFSPQAPLPGQAVAFTSQSAPSGSSSAQIVSTQWDFNYDPTKEFGADASGANASTTFATPGAKTVAIKVTETGGGFDIASGTVVVNAPPQASFGVSGSFLDGDSATLSSTSGDPDGPLVAQQWDLDGDGQFDDAAGAVVSKALKKGAHTVRLRVTDSRGATATSERRVDVLARPLKLLTGVKVTLFGNLTSQGVKLKRLLVRTPGKANVRVTCKGKKCPKGARAASTRPSKTKRVRFKKFERAFPAGTLLTVTVTRPGYIGQQTTIKIRKGLRRYIRQDRCLLPGSSKPIACPDS